MKKILSFFIFFILLLNSNFTYAYSIPIWQDSGTAEVSAENVDNFLNIQSESAILIEQTTGKILFEKNSHEQLRPASVTKIMTILLIMEALDQNIITLETEIPCSEKASSMGGSQIWLDQSESLCVNDMLKAICVVSANDCSVAMAEYLAGSEEAFVQRMNERAKELGMNDTTFKNCHGIDEDGHVTSSYDISIMSRELLQSHPEITNYSTIWMDTLRDGKSELTNTNKLIRTYEGATGLKTGSTSLALYNLSASATRNNLSLIAVILRAPTTALRFSEAKLLLDYGFSSYKYEKIASQGDILQSIPVNKGVEKTVNIVFEKDSGAILKKTSSNEIVQEIKLNEKIEAPISAGENLGTLEYYLNNELISTVNLVAEKDIPKMSLFNLFSYNLSLWFNLLRTNETTEQKRHD